MAEKVPFISNVDWARVEPAPQAPTHQMASNPGEHNTTWAQQERYTTSSGTRDWNGTLEHWGMTPQLPNDVRLNTLPAHNPSPDRHTTSSGTRDWGDQLRHWGMRQ